MNKWGVRRDTLSNGGGLKKTYLNLSGLIEFGDVNQNIRIYDGDVIKIKSEQMRISYLE